MTKRIGVPLEAVEVSMCKRPLRVATSTGRRNTLTKTQKMACMLMNQRRHRGFTAAEKVELWDHWKQAGAPNSIGRAFGEPSTSIFNIRNLNGWLPLSRDLTEQRIMFDFVFEFMTVIFPKQFELMQGVLEIPILRKDQRRDPNYATSKIPQTGLRRSNQITSFLLGLATA